MRITYWKNFFQCNVQLVPIQQVCSKVKELISENYINEIELDDGEDETHELGNHQCEGALVEPPGVVDDEVA